MHKTGMPSSSSSSSPSSSSPSSSSSSSAPTPSSSSSSSSSSPPRLYEHPFVRRMPWKAAFGVGWWRIFLEYLRRHQRAQWSHDAKTLPLQPRLQSWKRRPDQTTKKKKATYVNVINIEERGGRGKATQDLQFPLAGLLQLYIPPTVYIPLHPFAR